MADKATKTVTAASKVEEIERIKQRLDMLDNRLDSIDSMVTAVAERIMSQPVLLKVICPHCGKTIEVAVIGSTKPGG